ncbi:hypothetical protein CVIRNUC_008383 [Coccomyxa viridis]|uniref:NAD/GMP synthase domain-containing protein n=1 Tax=Coccomyxa viridis TaxID=1274662 RepID=A0AAV1IDE7_9CHLO|nr:hypothetical protein CVIRNUC_008383 [Coccomyxa viridis]
MALGIPTGCLQGRGASNVDVSLCHTSGLPTHRPAGLRSQMRCLAALVTEIQTARTAGRNAAELGSLRSRAQERPDLKEVESLEALWAPRSSDDSRAMLEHLQAQVAASGSSSGLNVVALSGGTGSALVAYLVASVFEESTILCIGKSAALDPVKLQRARFVADLLGLDLWELNVRTGLQPSSPRPARVESAARSERAVYSWLSAIASGAQASAAALGEGVGAAVFCGGNRSDEENPARCGLASAPELGIMSPLAELSSHEVSTLAQALGLPEWGHAEVSHMRPSWTAVQRPTQKLAKLVRTLSNGRISLAAA